MVKVRQRQGYLVPRARNLPMVACIGLPVLPAAAQRIINVACGEPGLSGADAIASARALFTFVGPFDATSVQCPLAPFDQYTCCSVAGPVYSAADAASRFAESV